MNRQDELNKLLDDIMDWWGPFERGPAYDEKRAELGRRIEAFAGRSDPPTRYPEGSFDLE